MSSTRPGQTQLPDPVLGLIWLRPLVLITLFACATGVHADQKWEFDGITIGESTAVYERIAVSTAGRANSNNSASPSTVTFAIFGALLDFASTAMEVGPAMWLTLVLDAILQLHQAINHGLGTRRASGDIDIDGDDSIDTLEHGVIVVRST
jgi:hypothetical protein